MELIDEKRLFDMATEKLGVFVPSVLKEKEFDTARKFLEPGGQYVRFAVKEFIKKMLCELIKPVEGWSDNASPYVDLEIIFEKVNKRLPEHFRVRRDLIGYIFSEYVGVTISDIISLRLQRESLKYPIIAICVHGLREDDDSDWMDTVAEELGDEVLSLAANGDLGEGSAWFMPEQLDDFCHVAEYIYENFDRYKTMAENLAKIQRERYNL